MKNDKITILFTFTTKLTLIKMQLFLIFNIEQ